MSKDSKERFSDRVADYVKYRPDYPQAAVDLIYDACDSSSLWLQTSAVAPAFSPISY